MHLTTPRLHLREYTPDDLAVLAADQADPRMREFRGPEDVTGAAVADLLALLLRWAAESPRRRFQLALAPLDQPDVVIGSCGLRAVDGLPEEAEFGMGLAPDSWAGAWRWRPRASRRRCAGSASSRPEREPGRRG